MIKLLWLSRKGMTATQFTMLPDNMRVGACAVDFLRWEVFPLPHST